MEPGGDRGGEDDGLSSDLAITVRERVAVTLGNGNSDAVAVES